MDFFITLVITQDGYNLWPKTEMGHTPLACTQEVHTEQTQSHSLSRPMIRLRSPWARSNRPKADPGPHRAVPSPTGSDRIQHVELHWDNDYLCVSKFRPKNYWHYFDCVLTKNNPIQESETRGEVVEVWFDNFLSGGGGGGNPSQTINTPSGPNFLVALFQLFHLASTNHSRIKSDRHALIRTIIGHNRIIVPQNLPKSHYFVS